MVDTIDIVDGDCAGRRAAGGKAKNGKDCVQCVQCVQWLEIFGF